MEGLHVVAVGNLTELEGGLVVGVEEVGCAIDRLQISLHSPYSWIYNWYASGSRVTLCYS